MKDIFLYDPHTWEGGRILEVSTGKNQYRINVVEGLKKPIGNGIVFIADELCETNFAYFFPRATRVALLKESPIYSGRLDPEDLRKKFDLVLTHRKDFVDLGPPFLRVDYSANWVERDPDYSVSHVKTKLVSFIYNSLNTSVEKGYLFRTEIFNALKSRSNIDIYGRGVNDIEFKTTALNDYCFSIAMENSRSSFYYTEKLIDCFLTETVPIYWGCPDIGGVFDERGILSFSSVDDLMPILDSLSPELYKSMKSHAIENRRRCCEMRLNDFAGYFSRCMEAVEESTLVRFSRLKRLLTSKPAAALRYGAATIQR